MADDDNPKAFKHWFSPAVVGDIADKLAKHDRRFDRATWDETVRPLSGLELKARIALIADAVARSIPRPFPEQVKTVLKTLPPPFDPSIPGGQHLPAWPYSFFVGRYGLEHPTAALPALHALTQRMSAEFDIRFFLLRYPELTLASLMTWTSDASEHVRRLVSEGTRTRLPWGVRLQPFIDDPTPVMALLDRLHRDSSPYVRRSVANNLNDLAKDHPALVVERVLRWAKKPGPEHVALAARALRTLVKAGDPDALAALGVHAEVLVSDFELTPIVKIGETLTLRTTVKNPSKATVKVIVDFAVHFRSATRDAVRAPKVFKWKAFELAAGASATLTKAHPMRDVSIRRLAPGAHRVDLQVNGRKVASGAFELVY